MTRSTRLLFSGVLASCLLISGCSAPKKPKVAKDLPQPGYYWQAEENKKGVLVFVHGVLGAADSTFTNSEAKAYWPELVKEDPEFAGFNIYVYQFPTKLLSRSMSVDELAEDLRLELQNARVFDGKEVIFVCHSMGGLIVRSFLQKYQRLAPKVSFIYFFSTPTEGSEISGLARWLSNNPQFGDMIPIKDDDYLANQLRAWLAAQFPIASYCAYEDKATVGVQVVPMASAAALCNKPLTPISANHIQIVKPRDRNDKSHRALQNAFRETRPVTTFDFPTGLTLREAIDIIVRSDKSTGEKFRVQYIGCDDSTLDQVKIRPGIVQDQERERVIEKLSARTEALAAELHLRATKNEERAVYEIHCTN